MQFHLTQNGFHSENLVIQISVNYFRINILRYQLIYKDILVYYNVNIRKQKILTSHFFPHEKNWNGGNRSTKYECRHDSNHNVQFRVVCTSRNCTNIFSVQCFILVHDTFRLHKLKLLPRPVILFQVHVKDICYPIWNNQKNLFNQS